MAAVWANRRRRFSIAAYDVDMDMLLAVSCTDTLPATCYSASYDGYEPASGTIDGSDIRALHGGLAATAAWAFGEPAAMHHSMLSAMLAHHMPTCTCTGTAWL